ncbi:unnamed protein product, partial [Didymodactylos carnosus]
MECAVQEPRDNGTTVNHHNIKCELKQTSSTKNILDATE